MERVIDMVLVRARIAKEINQIVCACDAEETPKLHLLFKKEFEKAARELNGGLFKYKERKDTSFTREAFFYYRGVYVFCLLKEGDEIDFVTAD